MSAHAAGTSLTMGSDAEPRSTSKPPGPIKAPQSEKKAGAPKGRVLIVDDEPIQVRSIGRALRARGYDVESASNGREAAAKLTPDAFDVVLSDIAMPGMDGIQLLQFVREKCLDVPVVLV